MRNFHFVRIYCVCVVVYAILIGLICLCLCLRQVVLLVVCACVGFCCDCMLLRGCHLGGGVVVVGKVVERGLWSKGAKPFEDCWGVLLCCDRICRCCVSVVLWPHGVSPAQP